MDQKTGHRLLVLKNLIVERFTAESWNDIGLLTNQIDLIVGHPRLLRSLNFGDDDYSLCVVSVLQEIYKKAPKSIDTIEEYVNDGDPYWSTHISSKIGTRKITFSPTVFQIPDGDVEMDLVSVMMPFAAEFTPVFESTYEAAQLCGLRCKRADDIWENSTFIQDIFSLIFRSRIVVVDFTNKKSNVMYETGIAHTLGKDVVPITQSIQDIPSDMNHHRALKYLPNKEGLIKLRTDLRVKFQQLCSIDPFDLA